MAQDLQTDKAIRMTLVSNAIVPMLAILLLAGLTAWLGALTDAQAGWVAHSLQVERQLYGVDALLGRLEGDHRGFLLTDEAAFRARYRVAASRIGPALAQLAFLVKDNRRQEALVEQLRAAEGSWQARLATTSRLRERDDRRFSRSFARDDRALQALHHDVRVIARAERGLLLTREAAFRRDTRVTGWTALATLLGAIAFFAGYSWRQFGLIASEFDRRTVVIDRQKEELQAQNEELHAQYQELQAQTEELQQLYESLSNKHDQLITRTNEVNALQETERLKDQFLGILSHELRTPINAISGFGSILQDGLAGALTDQQHEYLGKMLAGADALLLLVNDLLDMSRIRAGRFELRPEQMDFADAVHHVNGALAPLAERKRHALNTELSSDLPCLMADRQRIEQVLTNLVGNAIKYTPEGGHITVRARRDDDAVRCEVSDDGPGIAPQDLSRLFVPFMQLDMSDTRSAGGTGLGLSICKALVEAHGGRIGVESRPGSGSTFWFCLPIAGPPR